MENLYVVKGGINKKKGSKIDENFFLITSDFRSNHGYIGKRSNKLWRLYTSLGRQIRYVADPSWYEHYSTFEECLERLKTLSKKEVVTLEFHFKEDEEVTPNVYVNDINSSELNDIVSLINERHLRLTPGAQFKLELYFERLQIKQGWLLGEPIDVAVLKTIIEKQRTRLEYLKAQLEDEQHIIRPDDIPNID